MIWKILIWVFFTAIGIGPVLAAGYSPLLAWRDPIYIAAGFAGIVALVLLCVQPALVLGYLPGVSAPRARLAHRWIGGTLVCLIMVHVIGLWITSPPDVIDALTFSSPTPFSAWGVIAMWAVFGAALLAMMRRRLRIRPWTWRIAHLSLTTVVVIGTIVHAILIDGTMEWFSKIALCAVVCVLLGRVLWRRFPRRPTP